MKFIDTHTNPDTQRDNLAPDISVYALDDIPQGDAKTELFVEVKLADTSDPFRDLLQPQIDDFCFGSDSDEALLVRGQLASYAAANAGSQFRIHTFTVASADTTLPS